MNINDYFDKNNIQVLTTEKTFDFITDISIPADKVDDTLKSLLEQNVIKLQGLTQKEIQQQEVDDKVFENIHIARTLQEMSLEDVDKMSKSKVSPYQI